MADVRLRRVLKQFGDVQVIKGVDLDIEDGEFCVFVGPSGCGKSTLLRLIAGLEDISGGELTIGGKDMTRVEPSNRGVAMVFQSYALYPHMTVAQNITFGLRMGKMDPTEIERRLKHASTILKLDTLLARKPSQLSGGQRQRVAIGRCIVRNPDVFLFDEPLSNLDASLRVDMRVEIGKLHQDLGTTMIYVTHDQVEAMTLADKIVVLSAGLIEQVGSPLELYHRPKNMFVAGFIGSPKMNFIPVTIDAAADGAIRVGLPGGSMLPLPAGTLPPRTADRATLGVRPEHLTMGGEAAAVRGKVRLSEHLGAETMLYCDIEGGTEVVLRADGLTRVRPGEQIRLGLNAAACHLFAKDGQAICNGSLL